MIAYLGTEDTVILPESINGSLYTVYCLLGVKNVIIPDTFTKIDDDAFHFCTTLESIVIPDSVTYIGDFAFTLCSRLTGIKIPSGVNYIGQDAFNGCSSITSIEIPDDVTVIQSYTFYNCNSLSRVTIGKNSQLTSIGSVSFAGCCNLTNIFIPKYVNSIEASAFNDTGVKKIIVSEDNVYFSSSNGILYDKEKTQIVFVLDTVTSVIIPNTVTNISSAFYNCSNIVSVTFEEGSAITTIGAFAFYGCSSLTEIVIPDSVTCIEHSAFFDCNSLTSLVIPSRVTSIGNSYTFSYCSSLTNIVFENDSQVTSIGNSLFEGCDSLISIVIPNGVTSIGSQAFYNCSNLKSVMFEENSCLETIGNSAFAGCISLISIEIPYAVTTIDVHAFNGCSSLSSVVMHSSVTSIGGSAFRGCSSLISIELPDEITCLETNTFCDCSSLVSVTFGENSQLSCIDESVFCNCGNLTDIEIPVGVTSIGSYAFYQCIYLTSIEIPANVTSIDTSAFYGCSSLYFVVNHSDLKLTIGSLDNGRVAYFAKLLIDKDGNKTYLDEESGFEFIDTSDGFRFIYDSGTYTLISYLGDEDTVIFPEDINGNAYTIYHMRGVKNIIIPATFTTVDDYAFFGCATLESIILHDGISDIGEYAFYGCSSLKSIDIPKNLTSINKYVFYECSSLTSIEIPDSVTSIGTCAFAYCYSLANITLPEDITKIGDVAFVETAFYNDKDNWTDGCLYIGNYLIRVDTSAKFAGREGVTCIAKGAFAECYYLTQVTLCNNLSGDSLYFLSYLETLIITAMPNPVYSYFGTVSYIPESLQTIVIKKTANVKSTKVFSNITGVTIYVEASEDEVSWDTYYEGWNNGNTVIYGGNYITVEYYDSDGALISNLIYQTSQLILRPYVCDYVSDAYKYTFIGWDTDGDGNIDFIPTTSASNITATALYSVELRCVTEGHNPGDSEKITEATCTTDGVKTYTCEYCGETYTEVIPATGHYYIAQVTSATCTEQGYTTYTCSYCGDTYVADYVDASGHTSGETVIENYVAATCTSNGSYDLVVYCSACGEELSRTTVEMPATGHDYVATVTSATCIEQGYTTYTCSYCDDTYVADYVDATGHTSGETVIENYVAATCTSNGSYDLVVYCTVCGEELSRTTEVIPATGHNYIISDTVDPTCTEQGYTVYTCQYCGDTYTSDYAEASGHSWNSGEITTAATCTTDGVLTYTCEHCGETHTELIAATGHTASDWIVDSEAGAGVEGHRHIECTECGEILYEETIAALPGDSGTTDSSTADSGTTDSSSVDSSTADSGTADSSSADSGSGTQSGSSSGDNKKKGGGCGAVIDSDGGGSGDLMIIAVSMVALCAVYALIRRYKKKG
ncbi:MAG: leucine-rich repeat domain-containing protein [Clostridia bacterium]|nr:leucine-rich repeat domain-containing protein [Clostridia bacterium]